jgi:hypothetical protein
MPSLKGLAARWLLLVTVCGTALLVGLLAGCSPSNSSAKDMTRVGVAERYGGYIETITVAKLAGYDYLEIVSECLLHKEPAMRELLEMTEKAGFDAASSEGHSAVLGFVLRDVGDRFFGECLAAEPSSVQQAVRKELLFDMGYDGDYEDKGDLVHHLYPKTFPDARKL